MVPVPTGSGAGSETRGVDKDFMTAGENVCLGCAAAKELVWEGKFAPGPV